MARKRNSNGASLIIIIGTIIGVIIATIIKLLVFSYDLITIYTSKYKQKSGNGFWKTYFNKGNYGEFKLYRKIIKLFGKDYVFTNLYLENQTTEYTEIDVLALSTQGIYVFEMKNYSGYVYGSEQDQYWTQVLNRFSKYKFYNPLRQNYAHTKATENYLEIDVSSIIPVIVFSNRSKLSKINITKNQNIMQLDSVKKFIKRTNKTSTKVFDKEELDRFALKLIESSNMSDEIKEKHISEVLALSGNKGEMKPEWFCVLIESSIEKIHFYLNMNF